MNDADLKLIRMTLAAVWLITGLVVLFVYPTESSLQLIYRTGVTGTFANLTLYLGALLDVVIGLLTIFRPRRWLWVSQAVLIFVYTGIISLWLPEFWIHPFGPLSKNVPILAMLWLLYKHQRPLV